jgi:hypothetical protein
VNLDLRYQYKVHSGTRELDEVRQIETWPFKALIVIRLARLVGMFCGSHPEELP